MISNAIVSSRSDATTISVPNQTVGIITSSNIKHMNYNASDVYIQKDIIHDTSLNQNHTNRKAMDIIKTLLKK